MFLDVFCGLFFTLVYFILLWLILLAKFGLFCRCLKSLHWHSALASMLQSQSQLNALLAMELGRFNITLGGKTLLDGWRGIGKSQNLQTDAEIAKYLVALWVLFSVTCKQWGLFTYKVQFGCILYDKIFTRWKYKKKKEKSCKCF